MSNNMNSKVKQPVSSAAVHSPIITNTSTTIKPKASSFEIVTEKQPQPQQQSQPQSQSQAQSQSQSQQHSLPCPELLTYACTLSIQEDKPIMMDYWTSSLTKACKIGIVGDALVDVKDCEKLLVKSAEEYTSPISQIFKVPNNFPANGIVIMTENSIYLVSDKIPKVRIKKPTQPQQEY
jgi:hypothetical protein